MEFFYKKRIGTLIIGSVIILLFLLFALYIVFILKLSMDESMMQFLYPIPLFTIFFFTNYFRYKGKRYIKLTSDKLRIDTVVKAEREIPWESIVSITPKLGSLTIIPDHGKVIKIYFRNIEKELKEPLEDAIYAYWEKVKK